MLFTDKKEYDKNGTDIKPMTNPFSIILDLLGDTYEGFIINVDSDDYLTAAAEIVTLMDLSLS